MRGGRLDIGFRTWWCAHRHVAALAIGLAGMLAPGLAGAWQRNVRGGTGTCVVVDATGDVIAGGTTAIPSETPDFAAANRFAVGKWRASDGTALWRRELGTTAAGNHAEAVTLNAAGDVFAVGQTGTANRGSAFTVVGLHGSDGADLWQVTIGGGTGISDVAKAVAVDGDGNVLAGGSTSNPDSGQDFVVVKLRGGNGTKLWRQTINGTANGADFVAALAVDASGDVFAAGTTVNAGSGPDFTVAKLAGHDGHILWERAIDDPGKGFDRAWALALTPAGDPVAVGYVSTPGRSLDIAVVKLNTSDGSVLWQRAVDGGAYSADEGTAVAVDAAGDVLVAGYSTSSAAGPIFYVDFTVFKLNGADGSEQWRHVLGGGTPTNDIAHAVAVDGNGDVLTAGSTQNPKTADDFTVVKLSGATGDERWRRVLKGATRDNFYEAAMALAVDPVGHAVAVGRTTSTPGFSDLTVLDVREEISGHALKVSDPADQPAKRTLTVTSHDPGLLAPGPGGPADPTVGGMTLQLVNPTTGEHDEFALPATNWLAIAALPTSTATPRGFVYRDPNRTAGPCTKVTISSNQWLKASCRGPLIRFSLNEPAQGALEVNLKAATGETLYCMLFAGRTGKDMPGLFIAHAAGAPPGCLAP